MTLTGRSFLKVFTGAMAARGIAFVNILIVARMTGVADFGRFSIFLLTMHLTWQIADCFDTAFINYAKCLDDPTEKQGYLGASLLLKGGYTACILILLWPGSDFIANSLLHADDLRVPIAMGLVAGCGLTFFYSLAAWQQEQELFGRQGVLKAVFPVGVLAGLAGLWLASDSPAVQNAMAAYVTAAVLLGGVALVLILWRIRRSLGSTPRSIGRILWLGKWVFGINVAFFVFHKIDVFFVSRVAGGEPLGVYSAGMQLIGPLTMATSSLAVVFLPASVQAAKSMEEYMRFLRKAGRMLLALEGLFLVVLVLAPWIVTLLYGPDFSEGAVVLRILIFGWMFHAAQLPFQFVYFVLERPSIRFSLECGRLLLAVSLLAVMSPSAPLVGTAWAITITTAAYSLISSVTALRLIRHSYGPQLHTATPRRSE